MTWNPEQYLNLAASAPRTTCTWSAEKPRRKTRYVGVRISTSAGRRRPGEGMDEGHRAQAFLDALDAPEAAAFEADYAARARIAYPLRDDGRTLLPFRRLFTVATQ